MSMMRSDMKCGSYEIREGTIYYYQSSVGMMKIVDQSLERGDLLNKHIKEKSFKIRATVKTFVPAKRMKKMN